jgi:hypothetical protein
MNYDNGYLILQSLLTFNYGRILTISEFETMKDPPNMPYIPWQTEPLVIDEPELLDT